MNNVIKKNESERGFEPHTSAGSRTTIPTFTRAFKSHHPAWGPTSPWTLCAGTQLETGASSVLTKQLGVQEFDMAAAPENVQNVCTHHRSFVDAGDLKAPSEYLRQEGMRHAAWNQEQRISPGAQNAAPLLSCGCTDTRNLAVTTQQVRRFVLGSDSEGRCLFVALP